MEGSVCPLFVLLGKAGGCVCWQIGYIKKSCNVLVCVELLEIAD